MKRQNLSSGPRWLWLGLLLVATGTPALADPPGRAARLSYLNGSVSFEPAGSDQWAEAVANRPLGTGDSLWADSDSRAEMDVGRVALRIDSQTSVTITNLDDVTAQLQLAQGTLELSVRRLDPGDVVEIDTPNLAFTATRPGTYRLNVAGDGSSTFVAVDSGQANVTGQGQAYTIGNAQAYSFSGTDLSNSASFSLPAPDDFDRFAQAREQRYAASVSAQYVPHDMIGYEDLDDHGSWQDVEGYGRVWTPAGVDAGWAPYRNGNWVWADPYGWTWVDVAPWGFAPFHYGRWALIGPRWGWIPGPIAVAPVYAPALVAFVGGGPGVGVSVSLGVGVGVGIGWFPLGPREIYRPAYAVSPAYVTRVNVSNTFVTNTYVTNVYNNPAAPNNYVNQRAPGAVTAVPTTAFGQGGSMAKVAVAVPTSLAVKAPVSGFAPIAPTARSLAASGTSSFHPPAQALSRAVVAATPPPPAPVPFSARQSLLAQSPGKPLTAEATASVRASLPPSVHAATARPVTLVQPPAGARDAATAHAAPPVRPGQLPPARPAAATGPAPAVQATQRAEVPEARPATVAPAARPPVVVARPPTVARPPAESARPQFEQRPAVDAVRPPSAPRPAVEARRPAAEAPHPSPVPRPEPAAKPHPEEHHGEKKEKE